MDITAAYYVGNKSFSVETAQAVEPAAGEVQIDVAFCGICGTDMHVYHGNMEERIGNHRVIGHEMSGVVSATGEGVSGFEPGQPIVVRPLDHCGDCPACNAGHAHVCHNLKFLGLDTDGAFQNKWTVPAHTLHSLPAEISLQHAALVEPVAVACHDVRLGRVAKGEDVLVVGGGPIGILNAMVARDAGANVLVSEVNEHRLRIATGMGFDCINPAKDDLVSVVNERTGGKGADVIFEVSGTQPGVDAMTAAAATRGRIVMVAIHASRPQIDLFQFFWREIEMIGARVYEPEDYDKAIKLVANGAIDAKAMITDVQDLSQINAAFKSLDEDPQAMKSLLKCS